MIGLEVLEEQTCPGCGGLLPVTTDPANEDAWEMDDPVRCHLCTAIARQAKVYAENPHPHALRYPVRRGPSEGWPVPAPEVAPDMPEIPLDEVMQAVGLAA